MSSSERRIDHRDAAVTAALAGAVLVILGYASGIGLKPPATASSGAQQPEPSTSAPATPAQAPVAVVPPAVAVAAPEVPTTQPAPVTTPTPVTAPPTTVTPPPPAPTDPPTCDPGLVESLLGELPLVSDVSTLVSNLVGALPLAGPATSEDAQEPTASLACAVDSVVGPSCCGTAETRAGTRGDR